MSLLNLVGFGNAGAETTQTATTTTPAGSANTPQSSHGGIFADAADVDSFYLSFLFFVGETAN